jgi:predicted amidohydrolase
MRWILLFYCLAVLLASSLAIGDRVAAEVEDTVTVACINFNAKLAEKNTNLERMEDLIIESAGRGANIIVFPETALTGYAFPPDKAASLAESIPGHSTERIGNLAAKHNVYVIYGMVERGDDDAIYNSAVVVGPTGLMGTYRKVHIFTMETWASNGKEYPIFETRYGPIAVGICWELYCFPEVARIYAVKGARLMMNLTAAPGFGNVKDTQDFMVAQLRARAQENGLFIVSSDLVGIEGELPFAGYSVILGPQKGLMMSKIYAGPASGTEEEILMATLDLSIQEERPPGVAPTFQCRQPQTYLPLVAR